jgi:pimeloyl-ACP methyl ester carboxylesterase
VQGSPGAFAPPSGSRPRQRAGVSEKLSEFWFGGAGDSVSRLVSSFAEARHRFSSAPDHAIRYFTQSQTQAARRIAMADARAGARLIFAGHSWGADTALTTAAGIDAPIDLLIGADPVAKPGRVHRARPENVARAIHIDALPDTIDRSDLIKTLGLSLGGVPRVFLEAEIQIRLRAHHADFIDMMRAPDSSGFSAFDYIRTLKDQLLFTEMRPKPR